jgi:hypothetical protein
MTNRQEILDRFKLLAAMTIVETVDLATIRAQSLSNLDRWNANGVWVSAHDEWRALMTYGSDADVIAAMTGPDENSNRLRQSSPYPGLISQEKRHELLESVGFFLGWDDEPNSDEDE